MSRDHNQANGGPPLETSDQLKDRLGNVSDAPDRQLSISGYVLRGIVTPVAAVGGERSLSEQISGFMSALYWHNARNAGHGVLRFVVGEGPNTEHVLQAIGTLRAALAGRLALEIEVGGQLNDTPSPNLSTEKPDWLDLLRKRDTLLVSPPLLTRQLEREIAHPAFHWYLSIHAPYWSGRIDGLEICRVTRDGKSGAARIGHQGIRGAEKNVTGALPRGCWVRRANV
jgi:hypothetical protein